MKEIEKLEKLGLYVEPEGNVGPYANGYFIGKIKSDPKDERLCLKVSTNNGNEIEIVEDGRLYPKDNFWFFKVWECVPGPAAEDFVCKFEQLQDAVDAVVNFFFGEPTIIDSWIFPLHRHPELNIKLIDSIIKNAIKVSQHEFNELSSQLWEQVEENGPLYTWEKALISQFLKISHISDKSRALMVRRDLCQSFFIYN